MQPTGRAPRIPVYLRVLTAVWVDIDFYRAGMAEEEVVGALHGMQRRGELPPISMLLFSGRGLWAFWVLRDHEDATRAVRAGNRNLRRWQAAQGVLHGRLAHLGADVASMDAAHIARVPGSRRHAPDREEPVVVGWQIQGPPGSPSAFTYTLDELERQLGIEVSAGSGRVAAALDVDPALRLRGQQGARGKVLKTLQQLDALELMRGG